jgi:CheY-like chemotaxis protein
MYTNRIFLAGAADNPACDRLWEALTALDCEVKRCDTMNALLAESGQGKLPQVVLLHTMLGGTRVYDFCRVFKNRFPTVPFILLAEYVEPRVRQWATVQGATDLMPLATPQNLQAVLQQVGMLLTTPSVRQELEALFSPTKKTALAAPGPTIAVAEVVTGLNYLSQTAAQYLGKLIITNYWQTAREELPAFARTLNLFAVDFGKEIRFKEARSELTQEEVIAVQRWVKVFIERGQKVVQDLPEILHTAPLNTEQRVLLNLRVSV